MQILYLYNSSELGDPRIFFAHILDDCCIFFSKIEIFLYSALHSISISSEFSSSRQRPNTKKLISNICRELGMEIFCASFWINFYLINVEISIICIVWLLLYEENDILSYALMVYSEGASYLVQNLTDITKKLIFSRTRCQSRYISKHYFWSLLV